MRVIELFRNKGTPKLRDDIYAKNSSLPIKDIHNTMTELDGKGVTPREILKAVRIQYGVAAMSFAKKHLPHIISEAVHTVPYSKLQIKALQELFNKPLPVEYAIAALNGILSDDGLNADLQMAKSGTDARPIVTKWIELNIPYLTKHTGDLLGNGEGLYSPIHGDDFSLDNFNDKRS